MHELSITRNIVSIATDKAAGRRVVSIAVEIGKLSGIEVDAVRFCFGLCAEGTTAEGARLDVHEIAGKGRCPSCGREAEMRVPAGRCACPARSPLDIVAGEELRIVRLETAV